MAHARPPLPPRRSLLPPPAGLQDHPRSGRQRPSPTRHSGGPARHPVDRRAAAYHLPMQPLSLQKLKVETSQRNEMVDVTERLLQVVRSQNITEGMLIVYVPHTTAAVTINENAD